MKPLSKEQISFKMSRVKSKGTSLEKTFGKALWATGLRYRKHYKKIVGTPDFVLVRYKIAVFCDSSFWHGYKKMGTKRHVFKSNIIFWTKKIQRNIQKDKEVNRQLRKEGWKVLRFWDFQIENNIDKCVEKVYLMTVKNKHKKG